jgi:hypothetical protein
VVAAFEGGHGTELAASAVSGLAASLEERALWSRYGL